MHVETARVYINLRRSLRVTLLQSESEGVFTIALGQTIAYMFYAADG